MSDTRPADAAPEVTADSAPDTPTAEQRRLEQHAGGEQDWKRWGTYLSERQWSTVREDYSADGAAWDYFPHDHARSRAYRWGEDGLLGFCDSECRLCFALALWNGRDPILKERLFGVTGPEGNHGEDVKEWYHYLDATPTHTYCRGVYRYPQHEFPYDRLLEENARRTRKDPEFELADTGIFEGVHCFDVFVEYAKASPDDVLIKVTVHNRGPEPAPLHLLPTIWFRNTWAWGNEDDGPAHKPWVRRTGSLTIEAQHGTLGRMRLECERAEAAPLPELLFTENETNRRKLFGVEERNAVYYVKDAFNEFLVHGVAEAVSPNNIGTKAAALYFLDVPAGGSATVRLRLAPVDQFPAEPFSPSFETILRLRKKECDAFYASILPASLSREEARVARQAYAGLLWSRQSYHYDVRKWLDGDPLQPIPPESRKRGRNHGWRHLLASDVLSVPDKWEYPWFAGWDLAFHTLPVARLDPHFAKDQLLLLLGERYLHPAGQLPADEFNFSDHNPPVHAWACWNLYQMTRRDAPDRLFLRRAFHKLRDHFAWWLNRTDEQGRTLLEGGFISLDNVGLLDRSQPLPGGARLQQTDATAWLGFFCSSMLTVALELAREDPAYEDAACKFLDHFVRISDALETLGGGLWDEGDSFYYDRVAVNGDQRSLRLRSMAGVVPLFASCRLDSELLERLPAFRERLGSLLLRQNDARHRLVTAEDDGPQRARLLAAVPEDRLVRVLRWVLDEHELLSPHGVRSLSKAYAGKPHVLRVGGERLAVGYEPAESQTPLFGGNSNWRGPVWFPTNFLLIDALHRYHRHFGDGLKVECPTGSGHRLSLQQVAQALRRRLVSLFLPDERGERPCMAGRPRHIDPHWRNFVPFHEFFHAETGKGLGASHQTGWTALVALLLQDAAPTDPT